MKETTVIEINGVKLEVDLRTAKRIDNIKVGSRVKVLKKLYDGYKVEHGVVIGFEPFEKPPTIIIATMELNYNEAKIAFVYYNGQTKDTEVVVSNDDDKMSIDKEEVCRFIEKEIAKKQSEITELENRQKYFLAQFASYWAPAVQEEVA